MCKFIFIGTISKLQEIPFHKDKPDFHVKALPDEFQAVSDKFKHPNIYYVGTSEGCGCDFYILQSLTEEEKKRINDSISRKLKLRTAKYIRRILGQQEKQRVNQIKTTQENEKHLKQTYQLIEVIENEVRKNGTVELYCCWAEEYEFTPNNHQVIHINKTKLKEGFEIQEREFITFKK